MTAIAVVYHSSSGRTKALAEAVASGAMEIEGTTVQVVSVDEGARLHPVLAAADAIVFGSPTYMGSASAPFKAFMDSTSAVWALQGWRDKLAAAFTHSAAPSGDKLGTLNQLAIFAAQHGMIWVGLGLPPSYAGATTAPDDTNRLGSHLGAMAQSAPGGPLPESDLRTAAHLGRRIADAARRWTAPRPAAESPSRAPARHPTARGWGFPPSERSALPDGIARTNLREIAARADRFEHHLVVCATIDDVQLEIATASEPVYFAHVNISDEYAMTLATGDELVDRFPYRTFLSDPQTGEDVGRYNHRVGDLVVHPEGFIHWPGRLRAPYETFDFPPGMRRTGLVLVYCASKPTPGSARTVSIPEDRVAHVKAYRDPPPPMMSTSLRGEAGPLATIGRTTLSLVEAPDVIAPPLGGWAVVLEAMPGAHAPGDLYRIEAGAKLDGAGIVRALVLTSTARGPDPAPPSWRETPAPPFVAYEEATPGSLPLSIGDLTIADRDGALLDVTVGRATAEVPRYWLARALFRVALHRLVLGYVETYGGFFVEDRGDPVRLGIRVGTERHAVDIPREEALATLERIYRAVAPAGYVERLQ